MPTHQNRKLAAILFADIVNYTSLMQTNEQEALTKLNRFKSVLENKVPEFRGKIANFYGDGCLAVFDSSVDAMNCAKNLQMTFKENPAVPVRIGLHSGGVVFEEGNAYGDAVNIASRVESLGIPGAVLLSSAVRNQIKNQPEFQLTSLGRFEFKNVEDGMTVYALANESFPIPKRKEMKGKLKAKKKNQWLVPLIAVTLLLSAFGFWKMNSSGGMNLIDEVFANHSTPLSKEFRDKRVAILVFENKTGQENFEDFGTMISDWITRGLMETGEANVISAANLQTQIKKAGLSENTSPELGKITGAGVVLQGRYFLLENQLLIHANIVDAEKGEVIHAIEPIEGPTNQMRELLNELTQEVLGYWAVKNRTRFLQNPPKYKAYQKYQEAGKNWHANAYAQQNEQLLIEAYRLDTTFYAPLLKLALLYNNPGKIQSTTKMDSVLQYIEAKNAPLTKWEKLRMEAIKEPSFLKRAQLNEQMYNMDASDDAANFNAALNYLFVNMPQKTVELLEGFDQQFRDMDVKYSWREPRLSQAYLRLGQYDKIVEIAESYPFPKMVNVLARNHLRALVELDSIDKIWQVYEGYKERGIYDGKGDAMKDDHLLRILCDAFYIKDNKELLNEYVDHFKKWTIENEVGLDKNWNMGRIAFYLEDYEKALSLWKKQEVDPSSLESWLHSILGVCYALNGNLEEAEKELSFLVNFDYSRSEKHIERRSLLHQGRILAAMGRKEEAIRSLKMALEKGVNTRSYKYDIFLKPLFGYPPFEEFVKPKG